MVNVQKEHGCKVGMYKYYWIQMKGMVTPPPACRQLG